MFDESDALAEMEALDNLPTTEAQIEALADITRRRKVQAFEMLAANLLDDDPLIQEQRYIQPARTPENLQQREAAWDHREAFMTRPCIVCGTPNWGEAGFDREQLTVAPTPGYERPVLELVYFTCQTCAHTVFFDARLLGVIEARWKSSPEAL